MALHDDPFEAQIRRQRASREQAAQAWRHAEEELRGWPALRAEVRERTLPALREWRQRLRPFLSRRPGRRLARRAAGLGRATRGLPWLTQGALRLRLEAAGLWLALNWWALARLALALLAVVLAIWALRNWELIAGLVRDLLDDFRQPDA
jgi:hypothetical protein